jgi:hypothetical protein
MPAELTAEDQRNVSHHLIFQDLRFALTMILSIIRREQSGDSMSWPTMTYLHYLSLIAYEIRHYSRHHDPIPGADAALRFEPSLSESRHSTKLFDDTAKTVAELLNEFANYGMKHRKWFISATKHPTLIRSSEFLQRLVDDTSVHLYDGQIISTSHSVRYHAGLDMDLDGQEISDRSQELASYLASLSGDKVDEWMQDETFLGHWQVDLSIAMDTRFESFYGSTFADLPLPESMALTMLGCQVSTAALLGRLARPTPITRSLAFKFRYASVWQVLATLRKISAMGSSFSLTPAQRGELTDLFDTDGPRYLAGRGPKLLRNTIVHYGARGLEPSDVLWDDPLLGLPQKFCDGQNWTELDALLEQCSGQITDLLNHWRGPFSHLLRRPPDG